MKKFLMLSIILVLCLGLFTACVDTLNKAPKKVSSRHSVGESVSVDESYFSIKQSFEPDDKKEGYIESVSLYAKITGYDADYTYFDCFVTVTWSYFVISDDFPTGERQAFSTVVELNASGDGEYKQELPLDACRGVSDIQVKYEWSGKATRL